MTPSLRTDRVDYAALQRERVRVATTAFDIRTQHRLSLDSRVCTVMRHRFIEDE